MVLCKCFITLIADILDTFMLRLNMSCQDTLLCSLIITLIFFLLYVIH